MNVVVLYAIAKCCLQCKEAVNYDDITNAITNTQDRVLGFSSEVEMRRECGTISEDDADEAAEYAEEMMRICYYCKRQRALLAEKIEVGCLIPRQEELKEQFAAKRAMEKHERKNKLNRGKSKKNKIIYLHDLRRK